MTFEQIIKDIRNKIFYPVYFLQGEESFFIDSISDLLEQSVLNEAEREFNQSVVYGRDVDIKSIIDLARQYPMAANHNVVIVKEAQDIKKMDELDAYLSKPTPTTILVFCYKYKKISRKAFVEKVNKCGVLFESKSLYDNQIAAWITKYLADKGYGIDVEAGAMLAENLGTDLSKIVNELSKLMINLPQGTKVTPDTVEQNIGISKEFNVFELNKALSYRDVLKANRIVSYFAANPNDHPMVVTMSQIHVHFTRVLLYQSLKDKSTNNAASVLGINRFFLNDYVAGAKNYPLPKLYTIFSILREYDLRGKGVNNESAGMGDLLREMIFRILH